MRPPWCTLANNVFKVVLVGRKADWRVVLRFALPAAVAAVAGALLLTYFAELPPLAEYSLAGRRFAVTPVKLVMAVLIMGFGAAELSPRVDKLAFDARFIPLGGLLSGFFGGLSGHQGALRSAFLLRAGLSKEVFVGTGVVSAVIVDLSRLLVYGAHRLLRAHHGAGARRDVGARAGRDARRIHRGLHRHPALEEGHAAGHPGRGGDHVDYAGGSVGGGADLESREADPGGSAGICIRVSGPFSEG